LAAKIEGRGGGLFSGKNKLEPTKIRTEIGKRTGSHWGTAIKK